MTREEAIKYLIRPIRTSTIPSGEYTKQAEAYSMAIEALSQPEVLACGEGELTAQSCDDAISRQAAIDEFPEDDLYWDTYDGYLAPHYIRSILEDLPPVQPEQTMRFTDADHVWIDGKQYISLRRFQKAVVEAQPQRKAGRCISNELSTERCECSACGRRVGNYPKRYPCYGTKMEVEHD